MKAAFLIESGALKIPLTQSISDIFKEKKSWHELLE